MNAVISNQELIPAQSVSMRLLSFERIANALPLNDFGLPIFLYRSDIIPPNFGSLDDKDQQETLQAASIQISYREGFPTFAGGVPIWGPMDHEPLQDFDLFKCYLALARYTGYRQLLELSEHHEVKGVATLQRLQELYVYNFWASRAKAYDLFLAAANRKLREQRIMMAENAQYVATERLISRMETVQDTVLSTENLSQVTPPEYIKMLKDIFSIQRQSIGLDSGGRGGSQKNQPQQLPNATFEVALRQVAKESGATQLAEAELNANGVDLLLADPQTAGIAQELIVRMSFKTGQYALPNAKQASEAILNSELEADRAMLGQD